ncbi:hypothetical protein [Streptomyces cyaneofuscatus]|uniref:hypothetical protein n=1 Tax=Streptomyces cyaneofuscatus TaxID=66883 RepID=UPI0037BCC66A
MNRPANVLVAALLHAAERSDKKLALTDLEQRLLEAVAPYLPAGELGGVGRVYREAVSRGPVEFLPEEVTSLPLETGYSLADFRAAVPGIAEHTITQPNVRVVDLSALGDDEPVNNEAFSEAMAEYGRGTTIVTSSAAQQDAGVASVNARVRMFAFQSIRGSDEVGADEIYWAVASGSDLQAERSFKTQDFGDCYLYHWKDFPAGTYLFDGQMDQHVSCEIQCWERDGSPGEFYDGLRSALKDFAEWAIDLSVDLTKAGDDDAKKAAGWTAFFAIGAGLLNAILGWFINNDDFVSEQSIGFTRAGLAALAARPRGIATYTFNGGTEGAFDLELKWEGGAIG